MIGGVSELGRCPLSQPLSPPSFGPSEESKEADGSYSSSHHNSSSSHSEQQLAVGLAQGLVAAGQPEAQAAGATVPSIRDFELLSVIGKGGFGKVYQVRQKKDGQVRMMWMSMGRIACMKKRGSTNLMEYL